MWMLFIPVAFIVLFLVYNYVILPSWKKKIDDKNQKLTDEFASKINGRENEFRDNYLSSNRFFKAVSEQIQNENITALISCQEKREIKDFLRQQAVNVAGKALGKLTGVGVKEVDNTEYYYLALTPKELHYLHYSEEGNCKEHLLFKRENIQQIEVGKITSEDMLKNNAYAGDTKRLSFINNDTKYKLFFYDIIFTHPMGRFKKTQFIEISYLFGKPFLNFTKEFERK